MSFAPPPLQTMFEELKVDRSIEAVHYARVVRKLDGSMDDSLRQPSLVYENNSSRNYSSQLDTDEAAGVIDVDRLVADFMSHGDCRYARYMTDALPTSMALQQQSTPGGSPLDVVKRPPNSGGSVLGATSPRRDTPSPSETPTLRRLAAMKIGAKGGATSGGLLSRKKTGIDWVTRNLERLTPKKPDPVAKESVAPVTSSDDVDVHKEHGTTLAVNAAVPGVNRRQRQLDLLKSLREEKPTFVDAAAAVSEEDPALVEHKQKVRNAIEKVRSVMVCNRNEGDLIVHNSADRVYPICSNCERGYKCDENIYGCIIPTRTSTGTTAEAQTDNIRILKTTIRE